MLGFVGPPVGAGLFIGRTDDFDERHQLVSSLCVADFNKAVLEWVGINPRLDPDGLL